MENDNKSKESAEDKELSIDKELVEEFIQRLKQNPDIIHQFKLQKSIKESHMKSKFHCTHSGKSGVKLHTQETLEKQ